MPSPDESSSAPKGGGPAGFPWWVWGAGVGIIVAFLYLRHRANASVGTGAVTGPLSGVTTDQTAGGAVDPLTGQLIDPFTGLPYSTTTQQTQTLTDWLSKAEQALIGAGFSPALISKALYDYTNGNTLTDAEANVVNKAITLAGFPPNLFPFLGNVPKTGGQQGSDVVYATTSKVSGKSRQFTPISGQKLIDLLLKSGLITKAPTGAGGLRYFTTKKFTGKVQPFDANISLDKVVEVLTKYGVIVPLHVQRSAA